MITYTEAPKAPRWIGTEAGLWAWHAHRGWRDTAANALSVQDRDRLLREAEELWQAADNTSR